MGRAAQNALIASNRNQERFTCPDNPFTIVQLAGKFAGEHGGVP